MAPAFVHQKATCPICKWTSRSFNLPAHILTNHPTDICIKITTNGHSIYASAGDLDFYVCLTCKKGCLMDDFSHNKSRWVTLHERKKDCRAVHQTALEALRQLRRQTPADAPGDTPAPVSNIIDIEDIWNECKSDKYLAPAIFETEEMLTAWDEAFDAKEGFKQLARSVFGYKKELTLTKSEMDKMVREHEHELTEHRQTIHSLQFKAINLESAVRQVMAEHAETQSEVAGLKQRIQQLEKEITANKRATDQ